VLDTVVWRLIINMAHEDNLSMTEEIQVWRMPPSLRGSVEDLQLRASHSPQESTRRPIYTITEAPGRN
jgi:hypothetical protein